MTHLQMTEQEQNLLKLGGLAGILGSIIFIVVFFIVGIFVGADPVDLEGWLTRFPSIRTARIFENGLYLLVLILWIPSTLALYYKLKSKSLAYALFGAGIGIVGLGIIAAGAMPHIAHSQLADIYYAADATPETQATIVLMWQGTWAIMDELLIVGLAFMPLSLFCFGVAMRQHPDFGNGYGWMSIIIAILGLGTILVSLFDPYSTLVAILVFGLIIFHFVVGLKLFNLSRRSA